MNAHTEDVAWALRVGRALGVYEAALRLSDRDLATKALRCLPDERYRPLIRNIERQLAEERALNAPDANVAHA